MRFHRSMYQEKKLSFNTLQLQKDYHLAINQETLHDGSGIAPQDYQALTSNRYIIKS